MQLYGETAIDPTGGWATVNGLMIPVSGSLAANIVYRNYQPDYYAMYGGAFGEQSGVQNENGLYLGLEFHPVAHVKVAGYFDQYKFPWLSYRKSAPAHGTEYFLSAVYTPEGNFEASLRYKLEKEQQNLTVDEQESGIKRLAGVNSGYVRYNQNFVFSDVWELENRFQWAFYEKNQERSNGFMLYQDIRYKLKEIPLQLDARIALYNTDNYQTRVYAYEHDVLYAFSVPAYYGSGMRTYLLLKYTPFNNLYLWLKAAQSYFADRDAIGSGWNTIENSRKTIFKLQLRYKF